MVPTSRSYTLTFGYGTTKSRRKQGLKTKLLRWLSGTGGCRGWLVLYRRSFQTSILMIRKITGERKTLSWCSSQEGREVVVSGLRGCWGGGVDEGLMKTEGKIKRKPSTQGMALIIFNLHQSSFCMSQLCHKHLWLDEEPPSDMIVY